MKFLSARSVCLVLSAAFIVCAASGCGRGIEIGPFPYDLPSISTTLAVEDLEGFGDAEEFVEDEEFVFSPEPLELCGLPSEGELEGYVEEISPFLARFLTISRIELGAAEATATSGDFSAITKVSVYYQPANNPDNEQLLASASSPDGFGSVVELNPVGSFDFLTILREQDDDSENCPKVRLEAEASGVPEEDITFGTDITVDVYARVSL
ncbi:MAG: hypothetical protein R6V12_05955 [Candidatus Hydrogenedentota bacterium]